MTVGAFAGLAVSILAILACSPTVGEPKSLDTAAWIGLGTVLVGVLVGAVVGAYLGGKEGPPKS